MGIKWDGPDLCRREQARELHGMTKNPVAAVIFELCDGNHTTSDIRSVLVAGYELARFPDKEFSSALSNMLTEGLIQPCSPASS